jgi:chromosome segregation ATPase
MGGFYWRRASISTSTVSTRTAQQSLADALEVVKINQDLVSALSTDLEVKEKELDATHLKLKATERLVGRITAELETLRGELSAKSDDLITKAELEARIRHLEEQLFEANGEL